MTTSSSTALATDATDFHTTPLGPVLQARIQATGLTINGLAKTTHIPRTTLRRQLGNTELLKLDNLFAVATVLGTEAWMIIAEAKQAERDAA